MHVYINDASLQAQYATGEEFEAVLRELVSTRAANSRVRQSLRTTKSLPLRPVTPTLSLREVLFASRNRDLRVDVLTWLDRSGPFVDDERLPETDDYFECLGVDVTDGGLAEACRRVKLGEKATSLSFQGGDLNFAVSPLRVFHGLLEDRLGAYEIRNLWSVEELTLLANTLDEPILNWRDLVVAARSRFPHLMIPDGIYESLKREAFDAAIRDRTLELFGYLERYMAGRLSNGAEGPVAREILNTFFVGDRALFTGESPTNERDYRNELSFPDPANPAESIFAPWHGKISRRVFRLHFEWPVPAHSMYLKILYLGPKITKR